MTSFSGHRPQGSLLRSAAVGLAATLVDLAVLALLIYLLAVGPRWANLPALLAGAAVQFLGNRHFAFRAADGCIRRQAVLFTIAEVVTLGLNAVLFDLLVVHGPSHWPAWPIFARLIGQAAVFLLWSYPVWRWIFRKPTTGTPSSQAEPSQSPRLEPSTRPVDDSRTTRRTMHFRSERETELIHVHR